MSEGKYRIACYGSLKRGFGNHVLLENATFVGEAKTKPLFTMVSFGWFPAVYRNGNTAISCEIYEVDSRTLARLDALEGHPRWYHREEVDTSLGKAWMYIMPGECHDKKVESGNWERNHG